MSVALFFVGEVFGLGEAVEAGLFFGGEGGDEVKFEEAGADGGAGAL